MIAPTKADAGRRVELVVRETPDQHTEVEGEIVESQGGVMVARLDQRITIVEGESMTPVRGLFPWASEHHRSLVESARFLD